MADDDEEPRCKVAYLDLDEGAEENTNWIKRAGKAKVIYPNGHSFEGFYDAERVKQGYGIYLWMGPTSEEDDTPMELAKFEGNYKDGQKTGYGKMVYPTGDIYDGEWFENKMQGEGSYTYKKTSDKYFGSWFAGKKHGNGDYEFGADKSKMTGNWENGQILTGAWTLTGAAVYNGEFKLGRPYGAGKFDFLSSGLTQTGSYVEIKPAEGEEEDEPGEGEPARAPNVEWRGDSLVAF